MSLLRPALLSVAMIAIAVGVLGADYALGQATLVTTYAIAGLGLVIIVGQAGQITLGQGALVALGAYVEALLAVRGVPPLLSMPLAVLLGAAGGALASVPAWRLGGLYFAMSTLAFALIVEEMLVRWTSLTRGGAGLSVPAMAWGGLKADTPLEQVVVSVGVLSLVWLACARWMRGRLGRAWRAVREDEIAAAEACGIDVGAAKLHAFVLGGGLAGLAGALYAHWIGFISPEQFGLTFSFELLMLVFIGGARRLSGALWGALVIVSLPQLIALVRDALPGDSSRSAGLETMLFGAVIVLAVLLRPQGLASAAEGGRRRGRGRAPY
ncbi:branched-chain amino acid ABC transporter permease [Azoarcus sp. L1K30]|uniref:branched-chain amino acid ABC transporter permease n=1 Tax=Azoarcus sp. L1K30 TaxID=2820277 RepID=UPI001B821DA8|nr:branched-chain amino acid ABC transporter permease [Azoarcus sp. L1K30]MBR0566785.1 branched-chain amino acid ABC transporter permease [Azoarcus sp. L1K30]